MSREDLERYLTDEGSVKYPPDRFGDNRWNQCLDALIAAWNRVGPDATLGALRDLELSPASDEPGDAA